MKPANKFAGSKQPPPNKPQYAPGKSGSAKSTNNSALTSFSSKSAPASKAAPRNNQASSAATRAKTGGTAAATATAATAGNVINDLLARILNLQVPVVQPELLQLAMALLNCFVFGVGVIVCGALNNDLIDVVIGILQLVIPFVGWVWAVIWGILMILTLVKK